MRKDKSIKKDKPIKLDEDSQLYIQVMKSVEFNLGGLPIKQDVRVWIPAYDDISLGSVMKPNKEVLAFKYVKKQKWFKEKD